MIPDNFFKGLTGLDKNLNSMADELDELQDAIDNREHVDSLLVAGLGDLRRQLGAERAGRSVTEEHVRNLEQALAFWSEMEHTEAFAIWIQHELSQDDQDTKESVRPQ